MNWIKVLPETELPEGARREVRVGRLNLLLIKHKQEIFALTASCPHMQFPLRWARITPDCAIICALHHSAFDLRTGDVKSWSPWPPVLGPLLKNASRQRALPLFPTRVEEGSIWVGMPEAL
jgi:nitrite reductase/ring-hydroxylating ferredoxin subunit